jgi:predicted nucleotidyltransferase component of viral defense system
MVLLNARQSVEVFHLLFLDQLGRKLDKQKWALKGGCNLRFFFMSPRYSDDMDLDVEAVPVEVLRDKVNAIISGRTFKTILDVRNITVDRVTEPKQTETTQRWKLGLTVPSDGSPAPTKIEFSRRGLEAGTVFEPVSPEIIRSYELPPIMAKHYPAEIVFRQKLGAILSRAAPQARDIFDLDLLLRSGARPSPAPGLSSREIAQIKDNVLALDFSQFKGQVVAFLEPDLQGQFDSEDVWDAMRWRLVEALGESRA